MKEEITITYVIDSYLKGLTLFDGRDLLKNSSKVLQMRYIQAGCFTASQSFLYSKYENKVKQLAKVKKVPDEDRLKELLLFIRELRAEVPAEFTKIGWYDKKVAE